MARETTSVGPGAQASLTKRTCKCSRDWARKAPERYSVQGAPLTASFPHITDVKQYCRKCILNPRHTILTAETHVCTSQTDGILVRTDHTTVPNCSENAYHL